MQKKRLGIGFVGGGFVGKFHIRSFVAVRDADVLGVVGAPNDKTAEEAAALARVLNVGDAKPYKTITDMVADPNIDAIWICSPNFTRIEVMEEIAHAVQTGKGELIGVCCEKPLGRNVAEAKKNVGTGSESWLIGWLSRKSMFFANRGSGQRYCLGTRCCNNGQTVPGSCR